MQSARGERQRSSQASVTEGFIGERRLWAAVMLKAVENWRDGSPRARGEAQKVSTGPDFLRPLRLAR